MASPRGDGEIEGWQGKIVGRRGRPDGAPRAAIERARINGPHGAPLAAIQGQGRRRERKGMAPESAGRPRSPCARDQGPTATTANWNALVKNAWRKSAH